MMVNLVLYPAEVLRQRALDVEGFNAELREILQAMVHVMAENKGVGLAAPQVGISRRFFVVRLEDEEPLFFVNPVVLSLSPETAVYEEGCLSLPGIWAKVRRPAALSLRAWDAKGKAFELEADGFLARVIQHELDHLDGVLFPDRLSPGRCQALFEEYERLRSHR